MLSKFLGVFALLYPIKQGKGMPEISTQSFGMLIGKHWGITFNI